MQNEILVAARISFHSYGLGLGSGLNDPSSLGDAVSRDFDFYRRHVFTSLHSGSSVHLMHVVLVVGEGFCRCAFCAFRRPFAGKSRCRLANFSAMMNFGHVITSLRELLLYATIS